MEQLKLGHGRRGNIRAQSTNSEQQVKLKTNGSQTDPVHTILWQSHNNVEGEGQMNIASKQGTNSKWKT